MASPSSTHPPLTTFPLFPTLPNELQQHIWHILALSEAEQRGVRNQRIAPDAPSLKRTVDDPSTIQLHIINQPHYLPKFLQVCTNSREVSERIYTRWPRYNGGYIYVNKARDIFHFAGTEFGEFWFLDANIARSHNRTTESDEMALIQFKEQIAGVQHFAFYYPTWKAFFQSHNDEDASFFLHAFPDMKILTITLISQSAARDWIADRRYRYVENGLLGDLRGAKTAGEFLGQTFDVVRKSYPASRMPVLKVATLVTKEREYMNLPEENRFTCVMYSDPKRGFI